MKTGTWYVAGFVIAFVYFYVYAVNYVRGDDDFASASAGAGADLVGDYVMGRAARQLRRQWSPRNGGGGVQNNIQGTGALGEGGEGGGGGRW